MSEDDQLVSIVVTREQAKKHADHLAGTARMMKLLGLEESLAKVSDHLVGEFEPMLEAINRALSNGAE